MIKYLIMFPLILAQLNISSDSTSVDSLSSIPTNSVKQTMPNSTSTNQQKDSVKQQKELVPAVVENNAFFVGEKLYFDISYGFIHAGTAKMEVKAEKILNDRPVYHLQTTAESAAAFDWIFKVDDVIDSYIDRSGLFSWKFEKRLREGGYKADILVDYFPEDSLADVSFTRYKRRMRIVKQENYKVKTPPFVFDVLAAFYYTRTQNLEVGKSISIINHDNKKVYELEVKVYGRETIETDAGTFRCLFVEPLLRGEGVFQQKGRLKIWLTDDQFKIPVLMRSEVIVGHISTELDKIEGIPFKIPALVTSNE